MVDAAADSMGKRIEEKMRDLMLAASDLDSLQVIYRGEPDKIPARLYPFAVVFVEVEGDGAGEEGFEAETGPVVYLRYDGYITLELLHRDAPTLVPDVDRRSDVASYDLCRTLTQAAKNAIMGWGQARGVIADGDAVVSQDTKERTSWLRLDAVRNGLASRSDNVTQTGTFEWHVFTRREEF